MSNETTGIEMTQEGERLILRVIDKYVHRLADMEYALGQIDEERGSGEDRDFEENGLLF